MDYKNFVLSYYKNAIQGVHIRRICHSQAAQKPNSHDYFQIYYVLGGSLLHSTAYGEAVLSEGDMFLIPPGEMHYIQRPENMELFTFSFMPIEISKKSRDARPANILAKSIKGIKRGSDLS
jgi:hypothetical protein